MAPRRPTKKRVAAKHCMAATVINHPPKRRRTNAEGASERVHTPESHEDLLTSLEPEPLPTIRHNPDSWAWMDEATLERHVEALDRYPEQPMFIPDPFLIPPIRRSLARRAPFHADDAATPDTMEVDPLTPAPAESPGTPSGTMDVDDTASSDNEELMSDTEEVPPAWRVPRLRAPPATISEWIFGRPSARSSPPPATIDPVVLSRPAVTWEPAQLECRFPPAGTFSVTPPTSEGRRGAIAEGMRPRPAPAGSLRPATRPGPAPGPAPTAGAPAPAPAGRGITPASGTFSVTPGTGRFLEPGSSSRPAPAPTDIWSPRWTQRGIRWTIGRQRGCAGRTARDERDANPAGQASSSATSPKCNLTITGRGRGWLLRRFFSG
ncbi:hypothetical protein EJ06DRAFT_25402 [Trichodelitschia bisporula]|uniref:Uncharacterized protein n=1 Tax=Trichodelitschia bisporula TaxID=703511 RepID=A0A6G1IAV5_9PEZI|nr:hypothetical protein EJ06DRAFT_25402 [Trichodelitschia bisporula]